MAAMSRVFWQMTNEQPSFEVRRIEPTHIEVILHDTKAANQNALREMAGSLPGPYARSAVFAPAVASSTSFA